MIVDRLKSILPDNTRRFLGLSARGMIRNNRHCLSWLGYGTLPDFIIIGAQRCGTTSLYDYLISDRQIVGALYKEVHFFDFKFHKGLNFYAEFFPTQLSPTILGRRISSRPFAVGEASPYYLMHPDLPNRIATTLPHVKMIVCLRNPIDRAYSHFHHERNMRREPFPTFEEALAHEQVRLDGEEAKLATIPQYFSNSHWRYAYKQAGLYDGYISKWLDFFPREQFLFVKSENMFKDPQSTVNDVLRFLGLDDNWRFDSKRFKIDSANYKDRINPGTYQQLQEYFAPHNERLGSLIGPEYRW
jgi:hypothetical protein